MANSNTDPLETLSREILALAESHPKGLSDKEITEKLKEDVKPELRLQVYNRLLNSSRLELHTRNVIVAGKPQAVPVYRWKSLEDALKFRGLDRSEKLVYDVVKRGKEIGVSRRDLKIRTNIQNATEMKQILERLVSKRLIKEIKSVQGKNKKVYIISELEPSKTHTGGPWYGDDGEIDHTFINAIYVVLDKYMQKQDFATVDDVATYVAESKISKEKLSPSDLKELVMTMVYDGVLEECEGHGDGKEYFRRAKAAKAVNQLDGVPCGKCPVFNDCVPGGVISPVNCIYMTEWMKDVDMAW